MANSLTSDMTYEDIEDIQSFNQVADERGYNIGENADHMAVGLYNGQNVIMESQDSEEASYNIMADIMSEELAGYDLRAPTAFYDSESTLEEVGANFPGVLITEELGEDSYENSESNELEFVESLIDTFAFEALMGQGDIPENTDVDSEGFYMFDFGNSGANIKGVYEAIKSQAQSIASENSLDEHIDDYDIIGERAAEMAGKIDLNSLRDKAESRDVFESAYADVESNIKVARDKPESADPEVYFSPESQEEDEGVELL